MTPCPRQVRRKRPPRKLTAADFRLGVAAARAFLLLLVERHLAAPPATGVRLRVAFTERGRALCHGTQKSFEALIWKPRNRE